MPPFFSISAALFAVAIATDVPSYAHLSAARVASPLADFKHGEQCGLRASHLTCREKEEKSEEVSFSVPDGIEFRDADKLSPPSPNRLNAKGFKKWTVVGGDERWRAAERVNSLCELDKYHT